MNFRTLAPDELARLAENGNQGAIDYLAKNAHDLLTNAAEASETSLRIAFENGESDGYDTGWSRAKDSLREEYGGRIEDVMAHLLGKKTDPDQLPSKRRKAWALLGDILADLS